MDKEFPIIVEELYHAFVGEPTPRLWPEYLRDAPVQGHGMWAFYQGLEVGLRLAAACLERG